MFRGICCSPGPVVLQTRSKRRGWPAGKSSSPRRPPGAPHITLTFPRRCTWLTSGLISLYGRRPPLTSSLSCGEFKVFVLICQRGEIHLKKCYWNKIHDEWSLIISSRFIVLNNKEKSVWYIIKYIVLYFPTPFQPGNGELVHSNNAFYAWNVLIGQVSLIKKGFIDPTVFYQTRMKTC